MRLSRVFAVFSVSLIAVTAGLSPAQGVEPSPAPTPSASEAVEEPAAPEAAPEPTASPAASPEATPESPDDPLSVGDRLASEIDSIPSRPDVPSVDHNPEARVQTTQMRRYLMPLLRFSNPASRPQTTSSVSTPPPPKRY